MSTKNACGKSDHSLDGGFVSLGRHELAGLEKTHAPYQVTADALESEFPPINT